MMYSDSSMIEGAMSDEMNDMTLADICKSVEKQLSKGYIKQNHADVVNSIFMKDDEVFAEQVLKSLIDSTVDVIEAFAWSRIYDDFKSYILDTEVKIEDDYDVDFLDCS